MGRTGKEPEKVLLSERELEVVRLLAEGLTNREIGERLYLSFETIKWYNKQIYQKLAVSNRGQAVAQAHKLGLLKSSEEPLQLKEEPTLKIPPTLTSFVGREVETEELQNLLQGNRLVTITGPGGSGKTRLSLHVAERMGSQFTNGVNFVSLAATRQVNQVASALAQGLGVTEQADRPVMESIQSYLSRKELLLILDNFEHLLAAAPMVTSLLAAAPRLTVLATSRELLHISGEHEYALYPLELPAKNLTTATSLESFAAIALFRQRAQTAAPSFALSDDNATAVAAICRRLDGLPLAIELAAAWIKLFSPEELLDRLHSRLALLIGGPQDVASRQRTLRNTLDWSYQLLTAEEQTFFNRLAVFVGGRTIEAMEAICSPGLPHETINLLSALFDKSLVYQEQGPENKARFIMLETIHEYAWEQLQASGEDKLVRDRHLAYFMGLAEEMMVGYRWHSQIGYLEQTTAEMNNLRAAFAWGLHTEQYEAAARLVAALQYYLYHRGSPIEGLQMVEQVLPFIDLIREQYRVSFLIGAADLAWVNDRLETARDYLQQSLELAREMGNRKFEALSLLGLSMAGIDHEPYETAFARTTHALEILKQINYLPGVAQALTDLGELARLNGDIQTAQENYEACLAVCRETGEIHRLTMTLVNLSMTAYDAGDYQQARDYSLEAIHHWVEVNARSSLAALLEMLSGPFARLGQPLKATRLLAAGQTQLIEMGVGEHPSDMGQIEKYRNYLREVLREEEFAQAWAEGSSFTLQAALAYASEV